MSISPHPDVRFCSRLSSFAPHRHCFASVLLLASSEFNYPTVVLRCCRAGWWRIHYLITPLDKTVTSQSLPFIFPLTLGLQLYSLVRLSSPGRHLHSHLLQTRWAHRALGVSEPTETLFCELLLRCREWPVVFRVFCCKNRSAVTEKACLALHSEDVIQSDFKIHLVWCIAWISNPWPMKASAHWPNTEPFWHSNVFGLGRVCKQNYNGKFLVLLLK